eukprot:755616_1
MKCSDEEYDRLEYVCVLTGLITDYVYHNLQLLFAMKSIYNVNGREIITPMCELEWDFEHRGNLAINDVYSSAVCVFYRLAVDTVKASIVEVNTAKWFSWMVNDAKKLGIEMKYILLWKLFVLQRFSTHQLAVWYTWIRNYYFLNAVLMKKGSTLITAVKSVSMVILCLGLYCIFRHVLSVLSRQNQRIDTEPGDVWLNHQKMRHALSVAQKEVTAIISGENINVDCIVFGELAHYMTEINDGTFMNVKLNHFMLDAALIDNDIEPDLIEIDTDDVINTDESKDKDEFAEEIIKKYNLNKAEPTRFNIQLEKVDRVTKKISENVHHVNEINGSLDDNQVCCDKDTPFDGARILNDALKRILRCGKCQKCYHIWCLWKYWEYDIRVIRSLASADFTCPDCKQYKQTVRKSLQMIQSILGEIDHHYFDEDDGRIPWSELKDSKHRLFSKCYNIFHLIRSIHLASQKEDKQRLIADIGVSELRKVILMFQKQLPRVFKYGDMEITLREFTSYKMYILKDLITKYGRLRDYELLYGLRKNCPKRYRQYLADYRAVLASDSAITDNFGHYWIGYDCAKSMGMTETPNENVGSHEKIIFSDRKESTNPVKVTNKLLLKVSYGHDAAAQSNMIKLAHPIFTRNYGNHVIRSAKPDSTYYRGVIDRKQRETNNGPMNIPIIVNANDIEFKK